MNAVPEMIPCYFVKKESFMRGKKERGGAGLGGKRGGGSLEQGPVGTKNDTSAPEPCQRWMAAKVIVQ